MIESLYELAPYAPIVLFIAAALDIFFVTGLVLYGAAMLSSVAVLHASGMISATGIAISALLGTLCGNVVNFYCGRLFAETKFIQQRVEHPSTLRARNILKTNGLLFYILIGRFVTFTRPLYGVLAGSLRINARRFFFYEVIIAAFWIIFWLNIILQGEKIFLNIISN